MFHVFHLHGGGDRWRFNPLADKTYDYAEDRPRQVAEDGSRPRRASTRRRPAPARPTTSRSRAAPAACSRRRATSSTTATSPTHYVSGMWAFWRVYDTLQPDFAAPARPRAAADVGHLRRPDRAHDARRHDDHGGQPRRLDPPAASAAGRAEEQPGRLGLELDGRQLQPGGAGLPGRARGHGRLGRRRELRSSGHPTAYPGDIVQDSRRRDGGETGDPVRPDRTGASAFPLLRTHVGKRPPFSPERALRRAWLGENGRRAPSGTDPSPFGDRNDGLCPAGAPVRHFNVVALDVLRSRSRRPGRRPDGTIFALAHDEAGVLNGTKRVQAARDPRQHRRLRAVTLTSVSTTRTTRRLREDQHPHPPRAVRHAGLRRRDHRHVVRAVRAPVQGRGPADDARPPRRRHDAQPRRASTKFQAGEWIAVGPRHRDIESARSRRSTRRQDDHADASRSRNAHRGRQYAGVEFVQYRWYPDVLLDNIFFHDHVDGIHDWGHGLVGQLIIEPKGSTYHDPQTGRRGRLRHDRRHPHQRTPPLDALAPGLVDGSFREMALWTIDQNPDIDSTLNLRAEPWADRLARTATRRCSSAPTRTATRSHRCRRPTPGDPFVIRTINVGDGVDTLHVDGSRFSSRTATTTRPPGDARPADRHDPLRHLGEVHAVAKGGAGGPRQRRATTST